MKWGIIGPGNIAKDFVNDFQYVEEVADQPRQVAVSVLSHRMESAQEFADEHQITEVFTDLGDFIRHSTAEIVYVATPHTRHFEEVKACLNAGLHVLCEKPMGINEEQYAGLYALAAEKKCYLLEGMWLRFLPQIRKLKELIAGAAIGKPVAVKASMCYKAPRDPDSRYFDPELGGGSLLDLGIYPVFLAILVLGPPDNIRVIGHLTEQGVDEHCAMLFGYRDGRHAVIESSLLYNSELPATIIGDAGSISIGHPWFEKCPGVDLHPDKNNDQVDDNDGDLHYPLQWEGHGLHFEIAAVLADLDAGKKVNQDYSPELSLQVIRAMDEVRRQLNVVYEKYE